jgi:hypothetical protein
VSRLEAAGLASPRFRLDRRHHVKWVRHLQLRRKPLQTAFCVLVIPGMVLAGLWVRAAAIGWPGMFSELSRNVAALVAVELLLLFYPLAFLLGPHVAGMRIASTGVAGSMRQVSLDPTGIRVSSEGYEARYGWPLVVDVAATRCLIMLRTKGPVGFSPEIVIPREVFVSPADADAFLAEARRLWSAARAAPPPA